MISRHRPLLTIRGILLVKTPLMSQPRLPPLTRSLILIGFFASIPPARRKVAIHPAICDITYIIIPLYRKAPAIAEALF
jgi:hypothetical protein